MQDQVTTSVVVAIAPKLEQGEIERSPRKPTENLDAYDYYLRGLSGAHQWTNESTVDALTNFYRAIELDPHFAAAYGLAARVYALRRGGGWLEINDSEREEVARLARKAAELGKDDAVALSTVGMGLSFVLGDHDYAKLLIDRAITLNPNLAWAWLFSGWVRIRLGEIETAIDHVGRALRLNPSDPHSQSMYAALAMAHFFAGRYSDAASWAEMAIRKQPNFHRAVSIASASYAQAGRIEEAKRAMARLLAIDPSLRILDLTTLFPIRRQEQLERWVEGMRMAGLPES